MSEPVLRVEGVYKSFGDHAVLQGIDLEVAPGEVVALIGARAGRRRSARAG